MSRDEDRGWPSLGDEDWGPTRQTLHRYLQIVGKIRMSLVPPHPHWWNTTLYVSDRGLTTGTMPYDGRELNISFDLLDHRLVVAISGSAARTFELGARPACAEFYRDLVETLDGLGVQVEIRPVPYDLEGPSFPEDTVHRTYAAEAVTAYWRVLAGTERVLTELASRFTGEASPVHLFWHLLDLSYTRHCGTQVMEFGFGFGDERHGFGPAFHARAESHEAGVTHRALLPYDVMRATSNPHQTLLDFYQNAHLAGVHSAGWDV
jgi:hypothetical protein